MNNSNPATLFATSITLVLEEIKNIKELRSSAHTKRLQFATDICLVAHGVRSTGYLVDVVFPPNPMDTFRTLLMALRRKGTVFKDVMFWHHTPTTQSFLVHVSLLYGKITALLGGAGESVFIRLDKYLSVSRDPPNALQEVLHAVKFAMTESLDAVILSLPELLAEDLLIPLTAIVVDYPVAYFPALSTQTSFLEGELLDVYAVSFRWMVRPMGITLDLGREHMLLKFSCPHALASNYVELSPGAVIQQLRAKFAPILGRIGMNVFVAHQTKALERVAL